jgi:hypothetical protein
VVAEWFTLSRRISLTRAVLLALLTAAASTSMATDFAITAYGALLCLVWIPLAAVKKVGWSAAEKEDRWDTLPLLFKVIPYAIVVLLVFVPFVDPPGACAACLLCRRSGVLLSPRTNIAAASVGGVSVALHRTHIVTSVCVVCHVPPSPHPLTGVQSFDFSAVNVAMLAVSGFGAFFVNWSGPMVLGACSALTHVILGQAKSSVVMVAGFLFLGYHPGTKSLGSAVAAIAIVLVYTRVNLAENGKNKVARSPVPTTAEPAIMTTASGTRLTIGALPPSAAATTHADYRLTGSPTSSSASASTASTSSFLTPSSVDAATIAADDDTSSDEERGGGGAAVRLLRAH